MVFIWRFIHILIGSFFIGCLVYLYYAAFAGPIDWKAYFCLAAIIVEGIVLMIFKGCPLTIIQTKIGDSKGFFDLFLPQKVLPFIVPGFTILTFVAMTLIYLNHF